LQAVLIQRHDPGSVSFNDLKIQEYLAGVKALGLISKLLTCPLWHLLEDKFVNILDMNEKYQQLVTFSGKCGLKSLALISPKDGSKISK
jgi:hypothetical protein